MRAAHYLILGCGFTGRRVAKRLLIRGAEVVILTRNRSSFKQLIDFGATVFEWNLERLGESIPPVAARRDSIVLHSIPDIPDNSRANLRVFLNDVLPARVIYLSTTSVYGGQQYVDETTKVHPDSEKSLRRVDEESFVQSQGWSSLVLRPAAIYGPERGAHRSQSGSSRSSENRVISRIHVDDLANLTEAALLSSLEGSYPVADVFPCSSGEVRAWGDWVRSRTPAPRAQSFEETPGRRVSGSKGCELLGVELRYPTYHSGVLASVIEEASASR